MRNYHRKIDYALTSRFNGNSLRAIRYEKGMAAIENTTVAAIEIHKVSQMLFRTSASRQVSANSVDWVAKNIPSNGATMKSKSNAPRNKKSNWNAEYLCIIRSVECEICFRNYCFLMTNCLSLTGSLSKF